MRTLGRLNGMLIYLAMIMACVTDASAAVFQYCIPVTTTKGSSSAFLWIPPEAKQVRGVVMAGMTLMEREFVKDPFIRKACAQQSLALVFLRCGLSQVDVQKVLEDLAGVSGYSELPQAPLLLVGHSAGGPQAKALAIQHADRCFGVVQYRGGVPGGPAGEVIPPGVPALMMIGQFDEFGGVMRDDTGRETWEGGRDQLLQYRAADERNLGCVVVEPGAGHFAWSDRNAQYLALWIRKAAAARIPESWPIDSITPIKCLPLAHTSGWLTDPKINKAAEFASAPYEQYQGDRARANWHFDQETALATIAYHNPTTGGFGRKDQFIQWKDPTWVDAGARYFFQQITWVEDGQTFEVHPVYREAYPDSKTGSGTLRWADAGKPVGRSDGPIRVRPVGGPVSATGPATLRIMFDALAPADESGRATFLAFNAGDAQFRYTEQIGMLPRGFKGLDKGKEQTLTFEPIQGLKINGPPVPLKATSDADLPVEFYVACGPARIENGNVVVTELPARSKLPVEVKIVAWQFGRGIAPLVKSAKPVQQSVQIGNVQ